jgi:hypothetical protein
VADDLQEIGSGVPVFPLYPNWAKEPNTTIGIVRKIVEFRGTAQTLISFLEEVPITFDAGFTMTTKEDEYNFIDFFNARRGKNQKFWVQHPKIAFELKASAGTGATSLNCYWNAAESNYVGFERIYILMKTGDLITRHIQNVTYNEITDVMQIDFATGLDRDLNLDNYWRIGRFLLCRYDEDALNMKHKTDLVSEASVRFYELIREYSLL